MSDEKLYVIPSESMSVIFEELSETQSISSVLLKHFVEKSEVLDWDSTPIMQLCELYSGSASVKSYVEELATNPVVDIPQQYKDKLGTGDVVITNSDYVGLTTLIEGLRIVKASVSMNYGVSFEVH